MAGVRSIKAGAFDGRQDVLVALGDLLPFLLGVDVDLEAVFFAKGEVKAGLHAALLALVDAGIGVALLARGSVPVVILALQLIPRQERAQGVWESGPVVFVALQAILAAAAAAATSLSPALASRCSELQATEVEEQDDESASREQGEVAFFGLHVSYLGQEDRQ